MYVGIITHTVYGISGNELPPPPESRMKTAYILDVDSYDEASRIMNDKGLAMREDVANAPVEPYSCSDSICWEIVKAEYLDVDRS